MSGRRKTNTKERRKSKKKAERKKKKQKAKEKLILSVSHYTLSLETRHIRTFLRIRKP